MAKRNNGRMIAGGWLALCLALSTGCYTSLPGTHAEVVEQNGRTAYVVGAVGMGTNRALACRSAVTNGVAEAARRFTHERDDLVELAERLADVDDGRSIVDSFARSLLLEAKVSDEMFNPIEHTCWVTVQFIEPLLARDGLRAFVADLKTQN